MADRPLFWVVNVVQGCVQPLRVGNFSTTLHSLNNSQKRGPIAGQILGVSVSRVNVVQLCGGP
jgi:hypothetical protein